MYETLQNYNGGFHFEVTKGGSCLKGFNGKKVHFEYASDHEKFNGQPCKYCDKRYRKMSAKTYIGI